MAYTGWLHDPSKAEGKGEKYDMKLFMSEKIVTTDNIARFDSSVDRDQDFSVKIGVGYVIRGEARFLAKCLEYQLIVGSFRLG
jgi:hypothetical protein